MKQIFMGLLGLCLSIVPTTPAYARTKTFDDNVQTINRHIEAKIYSYKKKKHYTAIEIGFSNPTDRYVEFTPKEIYLDDEVKYSQPLMSMDDIARIQRKKPSLALFPGILAAGLGVASIATSRSNRDVAFGLGMGALGMAGAAFATKGLENHAKQNKLVGFENNRIDDVKKIPPGMTLGGYLYFPATKEPKSVTIIAKSKSGKYEKKVFDLTAKRKR